MSQPDGRDWSTFRDSARQPDDNQVLATFLSNAILAPGCSYTDLYPPRTYWPA
jgi:hypothetical protein